MCRYNANEPTNQWQKSGELKTIDKNIKDYKEKQTRKCLLVCNSGVFSE